MKEKTQSQQMARKAASQAKWQRKAQNHKKNSQNSP
jgi:hypothetical protein